MNIPCFCPPIDGQQDSFPSFAVITKLAIISVDSILRRGVPSQRLFAMLIDSATLPPEGVLPISPPSSKVREHLVLPKSLLSLPTDVSFPCSTLDSLEWLNQ